MVNQSENPRNRSIPGGAPGGPKPTRLIVILMIVAGLLAGALYTVFSRDSEPTSAPATAAIEPEVMPEAPARPLPPAPIAPAPREARAPAIPPTSDIPPAPLPAEAEPDLDASDGPIRSALGALSQHPELAAWLVNDDLIRRFVVSIDNIAQGKEPRHHLAFMKPKEDFGAFEAGDLYRVDPSSYARYDIITDVFTSLDVDTAADIYFDNERFLREAYIELGYPEKNFHETMAAAISRLLATPILHGEPEFELLIVTYAFADIRLEALSPVQKLFLRMGPENVRRIQIKLRMLADSLGIPSRRLPELRVHIPDSNWYAVDPDAPLTLD